jgi:hypothetical protein
MRLLVTNTIKYPTIDNSNDRIYIFFCPITSAMTPLGNSNTTIKSEYNPLTSPSVLREHPFESIIKESTVVLIPAINH